MSENEYLSFQEAYDLLSEMFKLRLRSFQLKSAENFKTGFLIVYSNDFAEVTFRSDRGQLKFSMKDHDVKIDLKKEPRLKNVDTATEKNLKIIFDYILSFNASTV